MAAVARDELLEVAERLLRLLGVELARALRSEPGISGAISSDWIDQSESELGSRLHCRAVRRRLAEGLGGARHDIGRRLYFLTREAHDEEMMRSPKPGLRKARPAPAPGTGPEPSGREARVQARLEELRGIRRGK